MIVAQNVADNVLCLLFNMCICEVGFIMFCKYLIAPSLCSVRWHDFNTLKSPTYIERRLIITNKMIRIQ
jgi:hypothetical protein